MAWSRHSEDSTQHSAEPCDFSRQGQILDAPDAIPKGDQASQSRDLRFWVQHTWNQLIPSSISSTQKKTTPTNRPFQKEGHFGHLFSTMGLCSHNGLLVMLLFHLCQAQGIVKFFLITLNLCLKADVKESDYKVYIKTGKKDTIFLGNYPQGKIAWSMLSQH